MALTYALLPARTGLQFLQNTIAVADNMRANATVYLTQLSGTLDGSQGNPTLAQIAMSMNANATTWATMLQNAITWGQNNLSLAQSAAAWLGTTVALVQGDLNALISVANTFGSADKSTVANAQAACTALLSAVPAAPSIF